MSSKKREACLAEGLERLSREDFDGAITCFDRYIRVRPRDELPYCYRGYAHLKRGCYDRAVSDLTRAISLWDFRTFMVSLYYDRGRAFEGMGDLERAQADYEKYLELSDPDNSWDEKAVADARGRLNEIYRKKGWNPKYPSFS
ncbi:MAG: tetratricopeptide repeat protein [Candidatus Eremiobacteraeota bacterium]|nr:tetratricopeptide repeat protein [Candidatus Eremiobacteraeota bacterium]